MKPIDVKWSTYIDLDVQNNDIDLNFKTDDYVKVWKC